MMANYTPVSVGSELPIATSTAFTVLPADSAMLLLRPGRDHTIRARVGDSLPQMLMLIFENEHYRILFGHVTSEQFHRCLQILFGGSRNLLLQVGV